MTSSTPADGSCGVSKVARSATVAGSKTTTSANPPRRIPRPALPQPEAAGGEPGHLVHRLLQAHQLEVAGIVPEHAREGAPEARVRMRVVRQPVGADHRAGKGEHAPHVVLVHLEVAGAARLQTVAGLALAAAPGGP